MKMNRCERSIRNCVDADMWGRLRLRSAQPDLAAGIRRVKGVMRLGVRVGNWLTAEEGKKLSGTENADTLRRAAVTILRFEDLELRAGGELEQIPFLPGHLHPD